MGAGTPDSGKADSDAPLSARHDTARRAAGARVILNALAAGRIALNERDAKLLLAAYDIPTPAGTVVHSAQDAAAAVEALGGPAVLKGLGPDIQHKSDTGLVELGVRDAPAARAAYHRIVDRGAGRVEEGVLVEEWVPHERELLVGMRRDEQFGPVIAFGLGGIFTEAVADVAFALAPLDDAPTAESSWPGCARSGCSAPCAGFPASTCDQLERIIQAIAQMAADHPEIAEIDVNPLLVAGTRPGGGRCARRSWRRRGDAARRTARTPAQRPRRDRATRCTSTPSSRRARWPSSAPPRTPRSGAAR